MQITDLQPSLVWKYFNEITQIPRPSKKEEKMIEYLLNFAKEHGLEGKRDKVGNVLISKPATEGFESRKSVVLQSHMDMVCEKNNETEHNFETDPIQTYIEKGWVKARGTTLGGDDGIGIAAQMAVLADSSLQHGSVECLFTMDEESGMTGAFGLEEGFMQGDILLNLDSEDEGELFIGCSGGMDTIATFRYKDKPALHKHTYFRLDIKGLKGGHSGDDIHKGLGNAVKLLNRFLWKASTRRQMRLGIFEGGNLRNAIAREAHAVVAVPEDQAGQFEADFHVFAREIGNEYEVTEPNLVCEIKEGKRRKVLSKKKQEALLNAIYACPHGEMSWDKNLSDLVETSTNLASIKFESDKIIVTTSQRSSVATALQDIASMVRSVFELADAKVKHGDGYPGWKPNVNSAILGVTKSAYERLFGKEPIVRAIHAGLECGLFLTKYPKLDMVSFGPTIRGAHSPDERMEIDSVQKFWDLLLEVLKNIPSE